MALLVSMRISESFVAGLFNVRGGDIDYNPVFFGYAIITENKIRYSTCNNNDCGLTFFCFVQN